MMLDAVDVYRKCMTAQAHPLMYPVALSPQRAEKTDVVAPAHWQRVHDGEGIDPLSKTFAP